MEQVILTGFAAPDESLCGDFEPPEVPPRAREELFPDFIFRYSAEVSPSSAGAQAAKATLELVGIDARSIDLVISCSHTPDSDSPGLGSYVMRQIGLKDVPGLEVRSLGCGTLQAIEHAASMIETGLAARVLIVAVDFLTRFFPPQWLRGHAGIARGVCGDGAASFLVSSQSALREVPLQAPRYQLLGIDTRAVGVAPEIFSTEAPSSSSSPVRISAADIESKRHIPTLHVHKLFAHAMHYLPPSLDSMVENCDFNSKATRMLLLHEHVGGTAGGVLSACETRFTQFHDVFPSRGFIGSAGLPLSLAVLPDSAVKTDDAIMTASIGPGPSWGVAALRRVS